jgi:hypothetical protein
MARRQSDGSQEGNKRFSSVTLVRTTLWEAAMGLILLIIIILLLVGAVPRWPHSRNWGYYPSGFLGTLLIILLILLLLGYIPRGF